MTKNNKIWWRNEDSYPIPFDLQRFADEGSGEGEGESAGAPGAPQDAKGVRFVDKKDPVTGKVVKIPAELDAFLGHLISSTRKQVEGQYKPVIEKIESEKAQFEEVKQELEKMREASLSAEEKAQRNAERKIKEHETIMKQAQEEGVVWKGRFFETMIRNDILSSFGDAKLCNPDQVAILLRNEGKAKVEEKLDSNGKPTGEFETRLSLELMSEKGELETVEGTPRELFKKWIQQERNFHHVQNDLNPGGNSNPNTRKTGKVDYSKLSPVERMRAAREGAGAK